MDEGALLFYFAFYFQTAKNFTVQVTDENERPAEISLKLSEKITNTSMGIPESTQIDDVIGTIVTFDPDGSDKVTFTLAGNSGDAFKLSSAPSDCKQVKFLKNSLMFK